MTCQFYWNNLWDDFTLTASTEHENFPDDNTQHRDFNKAWRSQHGAGTGWGRFAIWTNINDEIDFQEGGGALNATLTQGIYDADTLCAEIKTQMDAAGGDTYTVEYIESGAYANMFKITSDAVPFSLLCNTGANKATAVWDTIGFSDTLDRTGQQFYYANYIRIHTDEWVKIDLGAATLIYAAIVRNHNLNDASVAKVQFSTDNFATISEDIAFATKDLSGSWLDPLIISWSSAKNYRYVRIYLEDIDNEDLYLKMGRVFIGGDFEPTRTFSEETTHIPLDPSILNQSEDGQYSSVQLSHYWIKQYSFIMGAADKANFEAMFETVGTTKGFFFCEDDTEQYTTSNYVKFNSFQFQSILHSTDVWRLDVEMEKLR